MKGSSGLFHISHAHYHYQQILVQYSVKDTFMQEVYIKLLGWFHFTSYMPSITMWSWSQTLSGNSWLYEKWIFNIYVHTCIYINTYEHAYRHFFKLAFENVLVSIQLNITCKTIFAKYYLTRVHIAVTLKTLIGRCPLQSLAALPCILTEIVYGFFSPILDILWNRLWPFLFQHKTSRNVDSFYEMWFWVIL